MYPTGRTARASSNNRNNRREQEGNQDSSNSRPNPAGFFGLATGSVDLQE